ncbi:glycoside hydrolase family 15 protein [Armillaria novae-zelandiae]|uniref:Glucoamylase n=1 Tax=Armillaria novae-zelandiae TaxID=153914 RepID=A0AA39PKX1_9AGAR|nr:glycoside hydrolase family 15 protein [Armillaria novae-zelandiae]
MTLLSFLVICFLVTAGFTQVPLDPDAYVVFEKPIAKSNLLSNIGSSGTNARDAAPGVVIASADPDLFYTWTLDSSLVLRYLIDEFVSGGDTSLQSQIEDIVKAQIEIQQIPNPSGSPPLDGLGEPKFYVNKTAFLGEIGRPRRDGPAMRAISMVAWANYHLSQKNISYVENVLWPSIKLDLDYTSSNWNKTTYDIWGEVLSSSYWTSTVQHRALRQGIALGTAIGDTSISDSYTNQAESLLSYWNTNEYMTANTGSGRRGLDGSTVLASIHAFDSSAGCDPITFQPCSDRALANVHAYIDSFSVFQTNYGVSKSKATSIGRYPEDKYMGGNPWYLAIFTTLSIVWKMQSSLSISPRFSDNAEVGTYSASSSSYISMTSDIHDYAEGFISVAAKATPSDGVLTEEYSRLSGYGGGFGQKPYSWSDVAVLTAFRARNGSSAEPWGAHEVSLSCSRQTGGWDPNTGLVTVDFYLHLDASWGGSAKPEPMLVMVYLSGSNEALGSWSTDKAIPLSPVNSPIWSVTLQVNANETFEYKYLTKWETTPPVWEGGSNRSLVLPGGGYMYQNDTWVRPVDG